MSSDALKPDHMLMSGRSVLERRVRRDNKVITFLVLKH
jgi:hypothetical protein